MTDIKDILASLAGTFAPRKKKRRKYNKYDSSSSDSAADLLV
eukprot:CAMPEP_0201208696 /NCGR_PEP_ID=MMETSP0851-20130426/176904_1 /ASSEMBLY_ACC=CAM_ASM_000631 /TAXON_ID=183588 /ORGANISM="Pseudo-nitzschia fraudulenta, Strain WWA7" /LENGTH=41 /DNA_ID= /DNA_START= /DNA_END= /DNA_ORIENTATION=